jgi:hypothetical protein
MTHFYGLADSILKVASNRKKATQQVYGVKMLGNWSSDELNALHAVLRQLPSRLVRDNPNLLAIGRAPKLINGPPHAPGHSMYKPNHPKHGKYKGTLVIFDKGVYDSRGKLDPILFGKSVLHELSHSFETNVPNVFGKPPFITRYAARTPNEDWAETFAEYFLDRDALKKKAPEKEKAITDFLGG